jgi:lysophospholipase L1-like esterase
VPASSPHLLFSFGTLREERVQKSVFGRTVPSVPAALDGFAVRPLAITDPHVIEVSGQEVHLTLVRELGAAVAGEVLQLTDEELAAADAYEVEDYVRRRIRLTDGHSAWAYLDARPLAASERVLIVGDSIAYGRCDRRGGWSARLAAAHIASDEARRRLFNLAIPGSTLAEAAEQTAAAIGPRRPDTLVAAAGINDMAASTVEAGVSRVISALETLAATAADHNARLVVLGPIWLDEKAAEGFGEGLAFTVERALALRDAAQTWCAEAHIDFIDMWEPLRDRPELFVDGVHPGADGHELLFRHLSWRQV